MWAKGALPPTAQDAVDLLIVFHSTLFEGAEPELAGRFRKAGESAHYGGEAGSPHAREGVEASEIHARLTGLIGATAFSQFGLLTKRELAQRCAKFLEEFFRIHPFVDGNGRVARYLLEYVVLCQCSTYRLNFKDHEKTVRKYRRALEYAHRHEPSSDDALRKPLHPNPWFLLASWIERHLEEMPSELEDLPPETKAAKT